MIVVSTTSWSCYAAVTRRLRFRQPSSDRYTVLYARLRQGGEPVPATASPTVAQAMELGARKMERGDTATCTAIWQPLVGVA